MTIIYAVVREPFNDGTSTWVLSLNTLVKWNNDDYSQFCDEEEEGLIPYTALNRAGLCEMTELSMWEDPNEKMDEHQIKQIAEDIGFSFNEEYQKALRQMAIEQKESY